MAKKQISQCAKGNQTTTVSKKTVSTPALPRIQDTIPDVFILESLRREDESEDRFEGATLARLLRMSGKKPKYHYFEDEREIPSLIHLFRHSQYRYLHFSSHGSPSEVHVQNDSLTYAKFSGYFKGHLNLRRVFFSCCELGSELFSETLGGQNKGLHSIVAPAEKVTFAHAAAMYQALYLSLFSEDTGSISHSAIREKLKGVRSLFPVKMHFSSFKPHEKKWLHETI